MLEKRCLLSGGWVRGWSRMGRDALAQVGGASHGIYSKDNLLPLKVFSLFSSGTFACLLLLLFLTANFVVLF